MLELGLPAACLSQHSSLWRQAPWCLDTDFVRESSGNWTLIFVLFLGYIINISSCIFSVSLNHFQEVNIFVSNKVKIILKVHIILSFFALQNIL